MHRLISWILLLSAPLSPATPAVAEDEQVFTQALSYTVKVKTRVEIPFLGESRGSGSAAGFVVDRARGWIMTNAHVASRSPSHVSVNFHGGEDYLAVRKRYVDPYLDLAILEIDPKTLSAETREADLACDEIPGVGHPVGAFGHPWGLSFTGTRGIISGLTAKLVRGEYLQTDAPINEGNSGGPLISMRSGQVVGINTSTLKKQQTQNTNFVIPIKYACKVLRLMQADKDPSPPLLPMLFLLDLYDRHELEVAVSNLAPEAPPLRAGDVIRAVVGVPGEIQNEGQWIHAVRGHLSDLTVRVRRDGQEVELQGRLRPEPLVTERQGVMFSGILFSTLSYRDQFEVHLPKLIVHDVREGSLGENEGIKYWDFLISLDGHPMADLPALHDYLRDAEQAGRKVDMKVKRFSALDDRLYDYVQRAIPITGLRYVGHGEGHAAAR